MRRSCWLVSTIVAVLLVVPAFALQVKSLVYVHVLSADVAPSVASVSVTLIVSLTWVVGDPKVTGALPLKMPP